jgi:hypothetical protein
MTPTDTIIALEKALEAGPTQESEWLSAGSCVYELTMRGRHEVNRWSASVQTASQAHELSVSDCGRLADYIAACSPLAIRTLLDAHASALRDAEELRKALGEISWSNDSRWQSDRADKALNRPAALDDNTKGAMSHG